MANLKTPVPLARGAWIWGQAQALGVLWGGPWNGLTNLIVGLKSKTILIVSMYKKL
jgi:hypothetical protein